METIYEAIWQKNITLNLYEICLDTRWNCVILVSLYLVFNTDSFESVSNDLYSDHIHKL